MDNDFDDFDNINDNMMIQQNDIKYDANLQGDDDHDFSNISVAPIIGDIQSQPQQQKQPSQQLKPQTQQPYTTKSSAKYSIRDTIATTNTSHSRNTTNVR